MTDLLPAAVGDFVFDLHDSVARSRSVEEQKVLYRSTFSELSERYFKTGGDNNSTNSRWPKAEGIASECNNDKLFLALYEELTYRQMFTTCRPTVQDRLEGWKIYKNLFDLLLENASSASDYYILPEWAFDIMHEFVYHFQGFCQYRNQICARQGRSGKTSDRDLEEIAVLSKNNDLWASDSVHGYLQQIISISQIKSSGMSGNGAPSQMNHVFGYYAIVSLSRLECLTGDYDGALAALEPLDVFKRETELAGSPFIARLNLVYHTGVAYMCMRRYKDATRVFAGICADMMRGFNSGWLKKLAGNSGYEMFVKLYDKMIALLAIATHITGPSKEFRVDEGIMKLVKEKYGEKLAKISRGEETYEEIFVFASPKFISPASPDYGSGNSNNLCQEFYRHQIRKVVTDLSHCQDLPKLRSFLKLYTSIGTEKLASFNDSTTEKFEMKLVSLKHKMQQVEHAKRERGAKSGVLKTAFDLQFRVDKGMLKADEVEKELRFERFFVNQINSLESVKNEIEKIPEGF